MWVDNADINNDQPQDRRDQIPGYSEKIDVFEDGVGDVSDKVIRNNCGGFNEINIIDDGGGDTSTEIEKVQNTGNSEEKKSALRQNRQLSVSSSAEVRLAVQSQQPKLLGEQE